VLTKASTQHARKASLGLTSTQNPDHHRSPFTPSYLSTVPPQLQKSPPPRQKLPAPDIPPLTQVLASIPKPCQTKVYLRDSRRAKPLRRRRTPSCPIERHRAFVLWPDLSVRERDGLGLFVGTWFGGYAAHIRGLLVGGSGWDRCRSDSMLSRAGGWL